MIICGFKGKCLCLALSCFYSNKHLATSKGANCTQVILIIWMWGSENPIEHVSNPTLNTRNFPHVNAEVVFGIKLQTLPTPDYILDQMMSESLKAT